MENKRKSNFHTILDTVKIIQLIEKGDVDYIQQQQQRFRWPDNQIK